MKKEMKIAVTVFLIILAIVLAAGIIYFVYTDYGKTSGNEQAESSVDPDGEIQRLLETDKKSSLTTLQIQKGSLRNGTSLMIFIK
ncbi:AsmA family protein [Jeotgalicoccus sp. WY2]|uniref:AsmA family protein n=1 Tax=Jeotgalicoccus sp. WY2 TaxID=2708346 RepID=UPI001BD3D624|nr:AsmA family protein [Jeotgalicoccus sp. WY2]